jgi:polyhydroxyalkanoate synthase subunit PhaC
VDLIPKPDQLVSAAGNVAQRLAYGGLADLHPTPRTLIDHGIDNGVLREVYHYPPATESHDQGDPVLLVTPLAAPALCYDLRRGCSLVEHLLHAGRPTYLVEYGEVSFRDRHLGMEPWIQEVVPTAIRQVSAHAGTRRVHLVGWSLGGTFALLAAAGDTSLPIASLTVLGSPIDVKEVPLVAPPRPLLSLTEGRGAITRLYRAFGGASQPLVRWAFQQASFQKLVTKPVAMACHLDDADYLAQIEAVDRFTDRMDAYPGRSFGQLYHRLLPGSLLVDGSFELEDRRVSLADITVPVLVFAGANDTIAPIASVRAVVPLLSGSREVRLEIVPGGHLGMLTGRAARTSTWPLVDAWVEEWSGSKDDGPAPERPRARKAAAKRAARRPAATTRTAADETSGGSVRTRSGDAVRRRPRRSGLE